MYIGDLQPLLWLQYIDDIFMLWTHRKHALDNLITCLNGAPASIKFSSHIFTIHVYFLVTLIIKNKLQTDQYTKPTDANYLCHSLVHKIHYKTGIPRQDFLWIWHICSRTVDYKWHSLINAAHLVKHGFPFKEFDRTWQRALSATTRY